MRGTFRLWRYSLGTGSGNTIKRVYVPGESFFFTKLPSFNCLATMHSSHGEGTFGRY